MKSSMRVGAACKWVDSTGENVPEANFREITVRRLLSLDEDARFPILRDLLVHNARALREQIRRVSNLPVPLRMWRISSGLLPVATHSVAAAFYRDPSVISYTDRVLRSCGDLARASGIRLSFHPGQFVVLGSQNPGIRENSRRELQYHCEVFTRMGYTGWHPDGVSVNIHVGVKNAAVSEMRELMRSSRDIENFMTLENDEFSWGAREIVDTFGDLVPVVLDVHHHWIQTGERIPPGSRLARDVRDTWRGTRPKIHLSMSDLGDADPRVAPDLRSLLDTGKTRAGLRAHCLHPWNLNTVEYAARFSSDIMWEGKDKNLGSEVIARHLRLI